MDVLHIQTFPLVLLHKICIQAPPRMPQSVKSTYSKNFIEHLVKQGEIVQRDLHVQQKSTPISNQNNLKKWMLHVSNCPWNFKNKITTNLIVSTKNILTAF